MISVDQKVAYIIYCLLFPVVSFGIVRYYSVSLGIFRYRSVSFAIVRNVPFFLDCLYELFKNGMSNAFLLSLAVSLDGKVPLFLGGVSVDLNFRFVLECLGVRSGTECPILS